MNVLCQSCNGTEKEKVTVRHSRWWHNVNQTPKRARGARQGPLTLRDMVMNRAPHLLPGFTMLRTSTLAPGSTATMLEIDTRREGQRQASMHKSHTVLCINECNPNNTSGPLLRVGTCHPEGGSGGDSWHLGTYRPNTKRQDAGKQGWLLPAHSHRPTDQDMIHKHMCVFIGMQSRQTQGGLRWTQVSTTYGCWTW